MALNPYEETLEQLDAPPTPAAHANPYSETLQLLDRNREVPLRKAFVDTVDTTPDRAAEARRLSLKFGIPQPVIERNFEAFTRRDQIDRPYGPMRDQTPALATWLEDPQNAAVAKDDLESLGFLEWIVTAPQRSFAQGVNQIRFANLRARQVKGETLSRADLDTLEATKRHMRLGGQLGAGDSWFRGAITGGANLLAMVLGGAESAAQYAVAGGAGTAAAGAAVGGLPGAAAGLGVGASVGAVYGALQFGFDLEAGLAYDEFLELKDSLGQPIDRDAARMGAMAAGAINAGLETVQLGALAKTIPGLNRLKGAVTRSAVKQALQSPTVTAALTEAGKTYAGTLTVEATTEAAQRAVTVLSGELAKITSGQDIERLTGPQIAGEIGQEFAGAVQAFALLPLPGVTLGASANVQRARRAQQNAQFFTVLAEGVQQSKTLQRLPEAAQAFLQQATKDGPVETVYAPVESWVTYWQSKNVDPAQMATAVTGSADALETAQRTGEDLAIPTARYAVQLAATEHNAFFQQELRFAPEEMNLRESQAFQEQLSAEQAAVQAAEPTEPSPAEAGPSIAEQIETEIVDRLVTSGVMDPSTAETNAAIVGQMFDVFVGQRAGLDPLALFAQRVGPIERVDAPTEPAEGALEQKPAEFVAVGEEAIENAERAAEQAAAALPDRRTTEGVSPTGVERRDEPIRVMDSIGAAAIRMLAEDPNIREKAQAMRDRAQAAGRIPEPPGVAWGGQVRELDQAPEPIATLTGDELGEGLTDAADLRRAADTYYRETLQHGLQTVEREGFGLIRFTWLGRKHFMHFSGNPDKLRLIPAIPEILRRGVYLGREAITHARRDQLVAFHRFVGAVQLGERRIEATVLVGEDAQGNKFYDLHVPKTTTAQGSQPKQGKGPEPSEGVGGPTTLDQSIALEDDGVNLQILEQGPRGRILFAPSGRATIQLFQTADLTTFLHEVGHLALELMGDVVDTLAATDQATLTEDQARILRDYQTVILPFLGVESRAQIGRKEQEQWADAWEDYLMEGKAPSAELRSVFARLRAWFVSVYRSVRRRVTLTDDVRAVMDRLLATEEAIEQAQAESQIAPLFTDAAMAGMSDEQFAAYRATVQAASDRAQDDLQQQLIREWQREQQAWWKAERETMRTAVAAEVHQQPVYRALSAIRTGTQPDGSPLVEGQHAVPMKLAKAPLADRYSAELLAVLRRRQLYVVEGGSHPDAVAELFGFSSGDELVQALAAVPPMAAVIEAETDVRMKARHGDTLLDGSLAERAREAVHGEHRQQVIQAELKALTAGLVKGVIPPASVIHAAAAQRIARMPVRAIRPGQFLMAARRASQRAFDLLATNQDRPGAVQAKYQELLNLALYREATQAKQAAADGARWVRENESTAARQRLGTAGTDYLDQWDGVLDRLEFKRVTQTVLDRRASLAKWIAAQEAEGLPVDLPEAVRDDARRVNWQSLTVEELQGVLDGLKQLRHLARLKTRLLKSAAKRELAIVAAEIVRSITEHSRGRRANTIETHLPQDDAARGLAGFFAWQRKLGSLIRQMDGSQDGGALWEALLRPINEAADQETVLKEQATLRYMALLNTFSKDDLAGMSRREFMPAIGDSLTRAGRLMVALNWGNAQNRQRLMGGYRWSEAQVHAILDRLDAKDWQFVQAVWKEIDAYWPEIAAKQQRVYGVAPEKVEPVQFATRFGTMPGGYFPIKYDPRADPKAQAQSVAEISEQMMRGAFTRATTKRGFTEARLDVVNRKVRLDFGVIWQHTSEVIHDLTHHEMLIDVNRVLAHKAVQGAILEHYGDQVLQELQAVVRDIAAGDVPVQHMGEKGLEWLRQGTSIARMGWNAMTAVVQPLGLTVSVVRVGPRWVARGIARWLGDAAHLESSVGWIHQQSPFMRLRHKTLMREINEIRNRITPRGSLVLSAIGRKVARGAGARVGLETAQAYAAVEDTYFWFISRAQMIADVPTWLGAYEKAMADPVNDEARAIALADQAVIDSQGSGHLKDLAHAQRGGPALKLFTQFMGYFSVVYNQGAEALARSRRLKDPASIGRLAVDLLMLYTVPMLLEEAIRGAVRGDGDDDEGVLLWFAKNQVSYALNTVVFVRELTAAIEGFGYQGPGGAGFFEEAAGLILQIQQGEADAALWKQLNQTAGILLHYPATQVQRLADAFVAAERDATALAFSTAIGGKPKE